MESGQMYIGSDRRNQPKEPISVPRRIRRLVFRGFGTRMTEGTRETGSFGPGSTNTPFGYSGPSCVTQQQHASLQGVSQRRIGSGKLSGQGTERYYFSGIARTTRKKPESYLVWYRDSNSGF